MKKIQKPPVWKIQLWIYIHLSIYVYLYNIEKSEAPISDTGQTWTEWIKGNCRKHTNKNRDANTDFEKIWSWWKFPIRYLKIARCLLMERKPVKEIGKMTPWKQGKESPAFRDLGKKKKVDFMSNHQCQQSHL